MRLTKRDWVEIFYALESKRTQILQGEYGEDADAADSRDAEDRDLTVKDWHEHLDHILAVIGPDGQLALDQQNADDELVVEARAFLQEAEDREGFDTGLALDLLRKLAEAR